jgi:MFS superfamily sulfate permease-like transporter
MAVATWITPVAMVSIPTNPRDLIVLPLFDIIFSKESILAIVTMFFVASLESILSASAVDKLDPMGRESNFNRELWSKGLVNLICGLIGGLPIIAEIVRSSANITQGAKSPLSNFSHSFFILIFVLAFPQILNMIPLSALAAILVLVGYRLAQPKQFHEMFQLGTGAFLGFSTTIILTLVEDLLVGVFAGLAIEAIYSMIKGASLKSLLSPSCKFNFTGDEAILEFEDSLMFFSVLKQKDAINQVSCFKKIKIDLSKVSFMDSTSLFFLAKESSKLEKAGAMVLLTVPAKYESLYKLSQHH